MTPWVFAALLAMGSMPCAQTVYPTGVTIHHPHATWPSNTVFPAPDGTVCEIDMNGAVVRTWRPLVPHEPLSLARPLGHGRILALSGTQRIVELDAANTLLWSYSVPAGYTVHNDVQRLANDNTLILCSQRITRPEISPLELIDDLVIEVDRNGAIVWEWFAWQHFAEFELSDAERAGIAAKGGDWAHVNSADLLPPNSHRLDAFFQGNLILSMRFLNRVITADHGRGDVLYVLRGVTQGQHDARMIGPGLPGAGNLLMFDNGSGTGYAIPPMSTRGYSRVLEVDPISGRIVWFYDATRTGLNRFRFSSYVMGGAQRLANGNTLICDAVVGRLFEVTPAGLIAWEYLSPFIGRDAAGLLSTHVYRSQRR
jgi:hypothetical protein